MALARTCLVATALLLCSICAAQDNVKVENATAAVVRAFQTHDIVMFGEAHANRQEYEWLQALVSTPAFADQVDDIVVEFGNSLYQKSVDRYGSGQDVPLEQVQKAWRNTVGSFGPPSPVYSWFYRTVRESNSKRRGKHAMRVVCGDPYIDWDKVKDREDIGPYLAHREEWYAQVVKDEVIARHHRALLIMGEGHFLRRNGPSMIEQQLRQAGSDPYVIIFGTNTTGAEALDHRFDSWPLPAIVSTAEGWVADLPALAVTSGGTTGQSALRPQRGTAAPSPPPLKLKDAADALLYVGPRDALTKVSMSRAELDGTPYSKELQRRLTIELGQPVNFLPEKEEAPLFATPQQAIAASSGPPRLPPPPKSIHDPLPPRPPSQ
jgi:hypothetical protein